MVAIAGGESAWNPAATGDPLDIFLPRLQDLYRPWSVTGFCSFGLWQIFLPVHHEMIARMSGLWTPSELAEWLLKPDNNARAAAAVLANQGLSAWSVYNGSLHLPHMGKALAAVIAARGYQPAPAQPEGPAAPAAFRRLTIHHATDGTRTLDVTAFRWTPEAWELWVSDAQRT